MNIEQIGHFKMAEHMRPCAFIFFITLGPMSPQSIWEMTTRQLKTMCPNAGPAMVNHDPFSGCPIAEPVLWILQAVDGRGSGSDMYIALCLCDTSVIRYICYP